MSLIGLLNNARDGLMAQSAGVAVAGQNVTNANTPGYVRRAVVLQARASGPAAASSGGVEVVGITRNFDRIAHARVVLESGRRSAADTRANALAQVEEILAPGSGSIGERIGALFRSFASLSGAPGDRSVRAQVLADADALGASVRNAASDLDRARTDLFDRARTIASEVNSRTTRIAELNTAIAQASAQGDAAADLRDQRDNLIREVGERVGGRAIEDASGRVTLYAAGSALVDGATASNLDVGLDAAGSLQVRLTRVNGGTGDDVTRAITEGSLAGVREARDVDIVAAKRGLDGLAYDLTDAVNTTHARGYGLDGVTGRTFFTPVGARDGAAARFGLDVSLQGDPDRIAAADAAGSLPGGNRGALELARIGARALGTSGVTPAERYGALASDFGARRAAAQNERDLRSDTLSQAEALAESGSGVSLDEEMANLTRFQRAYDASTKVLRVADELLESLVKGL